MAEDRAEKITTPSGFTAEISPDAWNDMEVLDLLTELSSGDSSRAAVAVSPLLTRFLGKEGKKALYDHVRTNTGRVPVDKVVEELTAILNQAGNGKKS